MDLELSRTALVPTYLVQWCSHFLSGRLAHLDQELRSTALVPTHLIVVHGAVIPP